MIDDDLLKRLLRINDEFFQICKWLGQKRDIERVSRQYGDREMSLTSVRENDRAVHFIMTIRRLRRFLALMIASRDGSTGCGDSEVLIFAFSPRDLESSKSLWLCCEIDF